MIPFEIQERIEYVLEKFDFQKVLTAMKALGWRWCKSDLNTTYVPNIYQLKARARYLLDSCYLEFIKGDQINSFTTGTGGFAATCSKYNNQYDFVLQFVLTEYDSEDYE